MASPLENTVRLVRPGEMVVPVSEILDKLGNKLTTAEKEQLLIAVLTRRTDLVRPGDLITADLMNQLLASVADLHARIALLGQATPAEKPLTILRIEGSSPLRVGNRVTAIGTNFSTPGRRNRVSIGAHAIEPVDNLSSDTRLAFDIPDLGIRTEELVTLTVVDATGRSATHQFQLAPALVVPFGNLAVSYQQAPSGSAGGTLSAGTYEFSFLLEAKADQNASVLITAVSSNNAWPLRVIDPAGQRDFSKPFQISKTGTSPTSIEFVVAVTAPSQGATDITVSATEQTAGTKVDPAPKQVLPLTVGNSIPTPETRISVGFGGTSTGISFEGGNAIFDPGRQGMINFDVSLRNLENPAGGTMAINCASRLTDLDGEPWVIDLHTGETINVVGPTANAETGIVITPPTGASKAVLLLAITGKPPNGRGISVAYRVPLVVK